MILLIEVGMGSGFCMSHRSLVSLDEQEGKQNYLICDLPGALCPLDILPACHQVEASPRMLVV